MENFAPPRGMRDFYPEDYRTREYVFNAWAKAAKVYGFEFWDSPVVETMELLERKAGEEISEQIYSFEDKSNRRLALRAELTPSLARMIINKQGALSFPVKWAAIGQCFRYERMTRGRKREHYQLNLDIIGEESKMAEAEVIAATLNSIERMGLSEREIQVHIGSRKLLVELLSDFNLEENQIMACYMALDKKGKISDEEIKKLMLNENISESVVENIIKVEYAYQELNDLPAGFEVPADRAKPWGTGHAVLAVRNIIKEEPFAVINADDFYGREGFMHISRYLDDDKHSDFDYCMTGFILSNTLSANGIVSRGVCDVDQNCNLVDVTEMTAIEKVDGKVISREGECEKELTGNEYVSLNMWGFYPSILKELENMFIEFLRKNINEPKAEFYLPFGVDQMIKTGKAAVKVLESKDQWFGITYKEDKAEVKNKVKTLVESGVYPQKLF